MKKNRYKCELELRGFCVKTKCVVCGKGIISSEIYKRKVRILIQTKFKELHNYKNKYLK